MGWWFRCVFFLPFMCLMNWNWIFWLLQGYRVISVDIPRVWNHHDWIQSFEKFLDVVDVHHVRYEFHTPFSNIISPYKAYAVMWSVLFAVGWIFFYDIGYLIPSPLRAFAHVWLSFPFLCGHLCLEIYTCIKTKIIWIFSSLFNCHGSSILFHRFIFMVLRLEAS